MPDAHATLDVGCGGSKRSRVTARCEFAGLDLLRLVACVSVLLYHFSFRGAARDGMSTFAVPSIQFASKYGFFGVDLFFVISGFVIPYSAAGRTATHFLISRFVRLYPAFIICMPVSFTIAYLFGAPAIKVTFAQLAANLVILSPLFHQGFVDGVYWSIVCEIIFYAWIFVVILLRMPEGRTPFLVLTWLSLSALNESSLQSATLTWAMLTKYSGFFAVGVMLHHVRFHQCNLLSQATLLAAALLANAQLTNDIDYHNRYYAGTDFDPTIALAVCWAAILCVGAVVFFERCDKRPHLALLAGGITYPLYLLHQNIGYIAFNRLAIGLRPEVELVLVTCGLSFASWIVWRFVERPAQRRLKAALLSSVPLRLSRSIHGHGAWLGRRGLTETTGGT